MAETQAPKAFVYVDGQNLRGNAIDHFGRKAMDANLPRMIQAIVANQRDVVLQQTRYYSGLPTDGVARAAAIAQLDRFRDQGIRTFANDIQRNAVGQYKEVGIDLKIAADMVSDFLLNRNATTFMLVSNDRDYEPVFALMHDLARITNRNIDVVNVICGNQKPLSNARAVQLTKELFERFVPEDHDASRWEEPTHEDFRKIGVRRLAEDGRRALDASAHAGRSGTPPTVRTTPLNRGTGFYIDANSLGASAKTVLGRTHLDLDLASYVAAFARETGRKPRLARTYVSQHAPEYDPVNTVFVENLTAELAKRGIDTHAFPYSYKQAKVGVDRSGPAAETPVFATVARQKRNTTQMLADVVKDILAGKIDDVVLLGDDKNLWPIAELAQQIGRFSRQAIEVRNIHMKTEPIARTNGVRLDASEYEAYVSAHDRLAIATDLIATAIDDERKAIEADVRKRFGPDMPIVVVTTNAEGMLLGKSFHWLVFDEGASVSIVARRQMNPRMGARYVLSEGELFRTRKNDRATTPARSQKHTREELRETTRSERNETSSQTR